MNWTQANDEDGEGMINETALAESVKRHVEQEREMHERMTAISNSIEALEEMLQEAIEEKLHHGDFEDEVMDAAGEWMFMIKRVGARSAILVKDEEIADAEMLIINMAKLRLAQGIIESVGNKNRELADKLAESLNADRESVNEFTKEATSDFASTD